MLFLKFSLETQIQDLKTFFPFFYYSDKLKFSQLSFFTLMITYTKPYTVPFFIKQI